jgi:hypothetical protein
MNMNNAIGSKNVKSVARNLKKLKPGFLPSEIFHEVCRLTVTAIVDIFPLRYNKEKNCVEVLLTKREKDDKFWPDMYHIPGVVLLSTDKENSLNDAFSRILEKELEGVVIKGDPVFVTYSFKESKRGREMSLIHWAEVTSGARVGEWFCENELPKNMIASQTQIMRTVVKSFKSHME